MLNKLHRWLFPGHQRLTEQLQKANVGLKDMVVAYERDTAELVKAYDAEIAELKKPGKIEDLMRLSLGIVPLDISSVPPEDRNCLPKHYTDGMNDAQKLELWGSLNGVFNNENFQKMCKYLVDVQGNWTVRKGISDRENDAGRFCIAGIENVRAELKNANKNYLEKTKPEEEFDEHEVVPGVGI